MDELSSTPGPPDDAEARAREAQLRGLDKLLTAALIDERTYERLRRRVENPAPPRPAKGGRRGAPPPAPAAPPPPPPVFTPRPLREAPRGPAYGELPPLVEPADPAAPPPPAPGRGAAPPDVAPAAVPAHVASPAGPSAPPAPPSAPPDVVRPAPPSTPPDVIRPPAPSAPAGWAPAPAAPRPTIPRPVALAATAVVLLAALGVGLVFALTRPAGSSPSSGRPSPTPRPLDPATAELTALRTAPAPSAGPVIDAAQATKLVRAFWPARERALSGADGVAVRALEGGVAAQVDLVAIQPCPQGCLTRTPRALRDLAVMVPRQARFPAAFMAEVATSAPFGGPRDEIMVFTRPSASAPWSLAFDTGEELGFPLADTPVAQTDGFDAAAPAVAGVDAGVLPEALGAYWQHWSDDGTAPPAPRFAAGAFTDRLGAGLHETLLEDRANDIGDVVAYTADPQGDGVWSFAVDHDGGNGAVTHGAPLTCGTVRHSTEATPVRAGTALVQDQGRTPFGGLLAPGRYARVLTEGVDEVCMLAVPGGSQATVVAVDSAKVRVTAVPA